MEERSITFSKFDGLTDDEWAQVEAVKAAADARHAEKAAALMAAWEGLASSGGRGRVVRRFGRQAGAPRDVAILRFTKTQVVCITRPTGLRKGDELRFKLSDGWQAQRRGVYGADCLTITSAPREALERIVAVERHPFDCECEFVVNARRLLAEASA